MEGVFVAGAAIAAGRVTRHELKRWYRPLYRGIYLPKHSTPTLRDRATAAWLASGRTGVIAGVAASGLHYAEWVDDDIDIDLIDGTMRKQPGLIVHDETLRDDEITQAGRIPVTTPARTAYDLGRLLPRGDALARLDALARARSLRAEDVLLIAEHHKGARGLRRLRSVLPLIDAGAASPKETGLRLLLIDAGLPIPTTQIPVCDRGYRPFAFLDWGYRPLAGEGWEEYLVSAEYDGDQHRKDRLQYVRDHKRQRKLEALGRNNIRVINEDDPAEVIARVTAALRSRGWRPGRN
ncbi:hypothetical protein MU0083_003634 [[Mycobacterium] kokjensenii]|uniref:DUF559 domain-containing protein n=1 Tax=[Mycobacterium] kokjensenii TaxID=3064287 RepID=A0ABM9LV42_9MYCO|nr:hypothetical protein [Mycolicibacter sp. MU0083]CAJ1505215.1 hypothetical protein MU0083_003634 [Mycolicibacter sp. MU0083]